MRNRQDGQGKALYVLEVEEEIRRLGKGGTGTQVSVEEARERGLTDALPMDARRRGPTARRAEPPKD